MQSIIVLITLRYKAGFQVSFTSSKKKKKTEKRVRNKMFVLDRVVNSL